jgi:phosphoglycolate phosphatase
VISNPLALQAVQKGLSGKEMRMHKAVIFDFDGTLADTGYILHKVYDRLAGKYGLQKASPEELDALRTISIQERFKKAGVPLFKLPRLAREALAVYGEFIDTAAPFPGIPELLHALKQQDIYLGIISSNKESNITGFLAAHNLELFDLVHATPGLFGKHRSINRVIGELGIGKQEAVYVGDELRDIVACKKVPLKIIAVSWGYDHLSLLQEGKPDYLVHHPSEILALLDP